MYPTSTYWARGEALYHFERYNEALAAYQRALTYPPDPLFSEKARQGIEKTRLKLDTSEET
jgi:tetratricopeptide (TPR) repeat protein